MNKGLLLAPILLLTGCMTPVMVLDEDCVLTTEVNDNTTHETWQCSGEPISDDDLAVMTITGITQ